MQPRARRIIPKTTAFFIQSLLQVFWGDEKPTALNHHPAKVVYAGIIAVAIFAVKQFILVIFRIDTINENMKTRTSKVV
jgi:preprotein translocase subunit Sec61beta